MLEPIKALDLAYEFYALDSRFLPADRRLSEEVRPGDAVVVINYFGLYSSIDIKSIKQLGAIVIEDLSQALYARPNPHSDFALYSLRKFLPIIDGGILFGTLSHTVQEPTESAENFAFFGPSAEAFFGRGLFDINPSSNFDWFSLFREGERLAPMGSIAISRASLWMLDNLIDYDNVFEQRRKNFAVLHQTLSRYCPIVLDVAQTAPLGYPIAVQNRKVLLASLYAKSVFPPVHWDLSRIVPNEYTASHILSRSILTLPCDQRFDEGQMRMIADCVMEQALPATFLA
jgi:dTDP-4-amino-4,6-dideoxygalactose transaminase